jgi:hypothetical protein
MVITQKLEMRGIEKSIITKLVHDLDEDIQEGVSE